MPPKKRGRPPLTKDYPNPLESPMAYSSHKVQKQGTHFFTRPLMRINNTTSSTSTINSNSNSSSISNLNGINTPSPIRRRQSEDHDSYDISNSLTKKGRFRGVILSTPQKKPSYSFVNNNTSTVINNNNNSNNSSNKCTPLKDDVFSPITKQIFNSSPPIHSPLNNDNNKKDTSTTTKTTSNSTASSVIMSSISTPNSSISSFTPISENYSKLSMSINSNGRATISDLFKLSLNSSSSNTSIGKRNPSTNNSNIVEKDHIISLIKNLRSNNNIKQNEHSININSTTINDINNNTNNDDDDNVSPTSTPKSNNIKISNNNNKLNNNNNTHDDNTNDLQKTPTTPKAMLSLRTGLSPHLNLESSIFNSPFTKDLLSLKNSSSSSTSNSNSNNNNNISISPKRKLSINFTNNNDLVFKFASSDPLLLNDETTTSNWQELIQNQITLFSPKRLNSIHTNTPPSWINFSSPQTSHSNNQSNLHNNSISNKLFSPLRKNSTTIQLSAMSPILQSSPKITLTDLPTTTNGNQSPLKLQFDSPNNINSTSNNASNLRRKLSIPSISVVEIPSSPFRDNNSKTFHSSSSNNNNVNIPEPITPKSKSDYKLPTLLECTPLIQQTMNGSLSSAKFIPSFHHSGSISSSMTTLPTSTTTNNNNTNIPSSNTAPTLEHDDDARLALKKLVNSS